MYDNKKVDRVTTQENQSTELVYEIIGGKPLQGEVQLSGSKNAALPIVAASLLTDQPIHLHNLPRITDIENMLHCIGFLGKTITYSDPHSIQLVHKPFDELVIPVEAATKIRASIVLLGPLLARYSKVILPLPGGCSIGKRPIDFHLTALRTMGVDIIEQENSLICTRRFSRLKAATIKFPSKTVTGTENLIMAAVLAEGTTTICNAAMEPEVFDLINFLNQLGADIKGAGTETLEIKGVEMLHGCAPYSIIADRIEAGTYLVAAAITGGCVRVKGINSDSLTAILDVLQTAGATISYEPDSVQIDMKGGKLGSFHLITQPFPGFPTDMQSLFLSLATVSNGQSSIRETLFENRFQVAQELQKMGAHITLSGNMAQISGVEELKAALVNATDLRSGAALVCAALIASGTTQIVGIHYIERGYEDLILKLNDLGATITLSNKNKTGKIQSIHHAKFFQSSTNPSIVDDNMLGVGMGKTG